MTQPGDASKARADSLQGRLIGGKFRIESLLGAGGMGNVYRAEQLSLAKPVAVKILHHDLMTDETVVKRFEREARHASRLDHPNLVRIIDTGRDAETGVLFIAMELLTGRDLGQVIAQDAPCPFTASSGSCPRCWRRWKRPTPRGHPPGSEAGQHHAGRPASACGSSTVSFRLKNLR
jgi:serine/threonine protein kinase